MSMIDVNKIRSVKALEGMKKVLNEFLTFDKAVMVEVYAEEYGWGEEDYEADKDAVLYLLELTNKRASSLGRHVARVGKSASPKSLTPEVPVSEPVAS